MSDTHTYKFEGVVFDLTIPYADVTGVEWMWTGDWSDSGEPLMRQRSDKDDCQVPLPFPTLYWDHGPLIPISPHPTRDQYRAAVDEDYANTVAAGYVETPAEFGRRIAAASKPIPAVSLPAAPTVPAVAVATVQSSRFQAFLRTLRRAS